MDSNIDLYSELQRSLNEDIEPPKAHDEADVTKVQYVKELLHNILKANYQSIFVGIGYLLVLLHLIFVLKNLVLAIYHVDAGYISKNLVYCCFWMACPFLLWIYSTKYDYWNFHLRKLGGIIFSIINISIFLAGFIYRIWCGILIPVFIMYPTSAFVTENNVFQLVRFVLGLITLIPMVILSRLLITNINDPMTRSSILAFKFNKIFDTRDNSKFTYDMQIVKDLATGKTYTIKEKDRSLHAVANGVTGAGKTSSTFTVAIAQDFNQMLKNLNYQKKQVEKLLKRGDIRLKGPMEDKDFSLDNFEAVNSELKILEKIKFEAPIAGMSAMAPNASFSDEIYAIAKKKGIQHINRLDPTLGPDGKLKEGFVGFNPLYIRPGLSDVEWMLEVSRTSVLVADVTQAVYDASGSSDVYFASLNKNITTTLTSLLLLTYPSLNNGKQPTLAHLQELINDFNKAKIYRDQLVKLYGKRNKDGHVITNRDFVDVGPFQTILFILDTEILGEGAEKMFDQSRGLRVIINSFLSNPLIRNIFCYEKSIDMDAMLAESQITVVNYALELGSDGMAFGLFFLLSFITAVLRRPGTEKTRLPHFCFVDELPVLIHPKIETCFSLFRQYRVAMFVAIQSLSQMEKSQSTSYLKNVLLGNCAHHFVFGRVGTEEMKLYQELAGTDFKIIESTGTNETALTAETPSISFSTKRAIQRENNIDESEIRYQDFQEAIVVTVDQGCPVKAFKGKVGFLPGYERIKIPALRIDWNKFYKGPQRGEVVEGESESSESDKDYTNAIESSQEDLARAVKKEVPSKISEVKEISHSFADHMTTKSQDRYQLSSEMYLSAGNKPVEDETIVTEPNIDNTEESGVTPDTVQEGQRSNYIGDIPESTSNEQGEPAQQRHSNDDDLIMI